MSPTQLKELSSTHEVGLLRACRCDGDLRAERGVSTYGADGASLPRRWAPGGEEVSYDDDIDDDAEEPVLPRGTIPWVVRTIARDFDPNVEKVR